MRISYRYCIRGPQLVAWAVHARVGRITGGLRVNGFDGLADSLRNF